MIPKNGFKGCFIQLYGLMTWMCHWYFDSEGSLGVLGTICRLASILGLMTSSTFMLKLCLDKLLNSSNIFSSTFIDTVSAKETYVEAGRNWNYHWKDCKAQQHLPKPSRRLRLMLLISSIYLDWVSVRRNKRRRKPKPLLKILKALSAHVKAKPAFEAYAFDIKNTYRRRCRDSQVRLVSTQQV